MGYETAYSTSMYIRRWSAVLTLKGSLLSLFFLFFIKDLLFARSSGL